MELSEVTLCYLTEPHIYFFKKVVTQAVELKVFWGNLLFIVKIIFDLGIKSKAGKEFTNKKKKKFGIGLTGSGLGNASAQRKRNGPAFWGCLSKPHLFRTDSDEHRSLSQQF